MNKYFFIIFLVIFSTLEAQVGIGTKNPNESSILDVKAEDKGFLFNQIKLISTDNPSPLEKHQEGLWVYNIANDGSHPYEVYPGLYYNDGTKWVLLNTELSNPTIGDIKASAYETEHKGWYLLNGQSLSNLPAIAQSNANSIQITNNLPDATDRILKGISSSTKFATIGGDNTISIKQNNLPNIEFKGQVDAIPDHSHRYISHGNNMWYDRNGTLDGLMYLPNVTKTTEPAGAHDHKVSIATGGKNSPIKIYPKNLTTQFFIYLGY
ncbi:hypothetical protein EB1_12900 [Empedobacter brevis NBRC 14943 = ATCC 43319]|uniref:Phage tail collar domain-containing protein n=1 Tax=Empedobacter brevis NBRC 14943 = ATCC 43319 TaxID=1218108 RepID=A0A511NF91_9FLAO|nr:hypothetical protein [Empedobacter brevis]GEM51500.1 hypothetical protein EB1_12900 [Empedobacter brevis NBRC 14943 = ATCC 43319]